MILPKVKEDEEMPKARAVVPELEKMVNSGQKKFVRYEEGAQLYSIGIQLFKELVSVWP